MVEWNAVTLIEGVEKGGIKGKGAFMGADMEVKGVRMLREGRTCVCAWIGTFPCWIKPICIQHWDWWAQFGSPHFYTEIDGGRASTREWRERARAWNGREMRRNERQRWATECERDETLGHPLPTLAVGDPVPVGWIKANRLTLAALTADADGCGVSAACERWLFDKTYHPPHSINILSSVMEIVKSI